MIHLLDLHLKNFMNIESLDMSFDTNEVVMIYGDNGSGKSSLISAIALALLNYRKGDSYKDFIRTGYETAHVVLNVLYRGEPMHFDILISNDKYSTPLTRKITFRDTTYNNSECNSFLASLDIEYLEHVMFLFQRDSSIVDLKSGERAKLLKKLLHFEFEPQVADLKNRLETESARYRELSIRLEESSKISFVPQDLLPTVDTTPEEKKIKELNILIYAASSYDKSKITSTLQRLEAVKQRIAGYEAQIISLEKDILSRNQQLTAFQEASLPEPVAIESDKHHKYMEEMKSAVRELETQERIASQQLKEFTEQLKVLHTGVCYVCGGKIDEDTIATLEAKIAAIEHELLQLKLSGTQLRSEVALALARYNEARTAEINYEKSVQDYHYQELTVAHYPELILQNEASLARLRKDNNDAQADKLLLEEEIAANSLIREQISKASEAEQQRDLLQQKVDQNLRVKAINAERITNNSLLLEKKTAHESSLAEMASTLTAIASSIEVLKRAIAIFELEFPNFIILRTCSHVENYINKFVSRIFPYMKVRLSQNRGGVDFYYTTSANSEEWLSVKMASGAQASILSLAWRVAIAKLYGITTLLLDEIDAAATDDNSKLIYEFISSLDEFHQIVLISHRKEALRAVASLADNVSSYWVQEGVYTEVTDTEALE